MTTRTSRFHYFILLACAFAGTAWSTPGHALSDAPCHLQLSQPLVDFGRRHRAALTKSQGQTLLGTRELTMTLHCTTSEAPRLTYRASAIDSERFSLDGPIAASYTLHVREAVLDGRKVDLGRSAESDVMPSVIAAQLPWRPGDQIVPIVDGVPARGHTLTMQLGVTAIVHGDTDGLRESGLWIADGVIESNEAARALKLTAQVLPASCTPVLSQQGEIDLGRIASQSLNEHRPTVLPQRILGLQIICDAPARFALRIKDDRSGTALNDDGEQWGLGSDTRNHRIGSFRIGISTESMHDQDHPSLALTTRKDDAASWSPARRGHAWIQIGEHIGFTDTDGTSSGPAARALLQGSLQVEPSIAPTSQLNLSHDIALDGHATLEVIYL